MGIINKDMIENGVVRAMVLYLTVGNVDLRGLKNLINYLLSSSSNRRNSY